MTNGHKNPSPEVSELFVILHSKLSRPRPISRSQLKSSERLVSTPQPSETSDRTAATSGTLQLQE